MKFTDESLAKAQEQALAAVSSAMKFNPEQQRSVLHLDEVLTAYRKVLELDEEEILSHQIQAMDSAVFIAWLQDSESQTHRELIAAKERMIAMLQEIQRKSAS